MTQSTLKPYQLVKQIHTVDDKQSKEKMIINPFSPLKKKIRDTKTTREILTGTQFHTGRKETVLICGFMV